jgi:hypothetical protein
MSELKAQLLQSISSVSKSNFVISFTICVSKNGDIYVFGVFGGTLDIGGDIAPIKDTDGNVYIAKYNSNLAPIVLRQLIGTNDINSTLVLSLATSNNGALYFTGNYRGTLSIGGDITPIINTSEVQRGFLGKYNSDLTPSQLVSIDSTEGSIGYSLAISNNDDVYLTGGYSGKLTIDSFTINSTGIVNNGFLAKYNRDLTIINLVGIDSTEFSLGYSLAISTTGSVYLTGSYKGILTIDNFTTTSVGTDRNGFLAKYNSDLTSINLVRIDSTEYSVGSSIAISTKGDVYVAGNFKGTLNIGDGMTATSNNGAFIAKYNSDLTPNGLNYMICTGEYFFVNTIKISSIGDVYVNGFFTGTIDIRNGTIATENSGGFIVKYNSNLNPISLNVIVNQSVLLGSSSFLYSINTMALTLNDELYVTGIFTGTVNIGDGVPKITIPKTVIPRGSFIAKYSIINNEPICVVAGTPIHTDQGIFAIEQIDTAIHTVGRKRIVSITKAITPEKHLICFEAHSLAINCPTKRTIMTPGHEVLYKGKLVQAKQFLGKLNGVHTVPYDGKTVYNVLQEKHGLMVINNMTVETLHPQNKVAKRILDNQ